MIRESQTLKITNMVLLEHKIYHMNVGDRSIKVEIFKEIIQHIYCI